MGIAVVLALVLLAGTFEPAEPAAPPNGARALEALRNVERAFAKTARAKGWRGAFLEFFATDAIALTPDPSSAIARLQSRPVRPFSEEELTWEPKAGDIAASGELGWLTGLSVFIDHTAATPSPRYGNYVSVWKKQKGGSWRVYIDIGTAVSAPVVFPTWFTHVTAVPRYNGAESAAASTAGLLDADRHLNQALLAEDPGNAYVSHTVERSRLHRVGSDRPVSVGADEIARWFSDHPARMTATTSSGESAASADLGYTYGKYEIAGSPTQRGAYLRVWSRGGDGQWRVAGDVIAPV